jgi:hypothetical protein
MQTMFLINNISSELARSERNIKHYYNGEYPFQQLRADCYNGMNPIPPYGVIHIIDFLE